MHQDNKNTGNNLKGDKFIRKNNPVGRKPSYLNNSISSNPQQVNTRTFKCNIPAIIVCVVMALFIIAEYLLGTSVFKEQNPYIVLVIIQFLVFILPCAFFSAIQSFKTSSGLSAYNLRPFSPKMLGLIFSALGVMLFGNMILKYLGYVFFGFVNNTTVIYENDNALALIASTVLVPAIVEEILIRGIVFTEYEKRIGSLGAILGSSVLFTFIHFDLKDFLSYFFAGIVLATVLHVTRSLLATITIHLLNNSICLYTDTFLKRVSKESISAFFVLFMLTVILLLALFALFESLEWICNAKADYIANGTSKKTVQSSPLIPENTKFSQIISGIFSAPAFIIALIIFLVKALFLS